jgi:hypothetical protein
MKKYGSGDIASPFLTLILGGIGGQLHASAALPPGRKPRYLLVRRLSKPQSKLGRCGVQKNLLPLPPIKYNYMYEFINVIIYCCRPRNLKGNIGMHEQYFMSLIPLMLRQKGTSDL